METSQPAGVDTTAAFVSLADKAVSAFGLLAVAFGVGDQATIGPIVSGLIGGIGAIGILWGIVRSFTTHSHAAQIAKGQQSQVTVDVANATSP